MKSKLDKIKSSGFKTPSGYLDELEDRVFARLNNEDGSKDLKSSGFNLPENYFDTVEASVLNRLETKRETKIISLLTRRRLTYISSVAAALILAFTLFLNNEVGADELNYEVVSDYILDEDIDSYDLAALLTEEELSSIDIEIYNDSYNTDSIEDYLLENVDLEEIIDQ